ncbi:uncharacterized protein LOC132549232 [Ylistrum balloti]|uniref:uncharacterized protein LOC132549232 n=1 Tax=Ylistrum balloti TaxID=509963 RepID=UPI00290589E8|nr:uncharacterized protein LOC132549232 [Ylistrum balloti]
MTAPGKFVPASPGFNIDFLAWDTPEKPVMLSPTALQNPSSVYSKMPTAAPPSGKMLSQQRTALMDFYSQSAFKSHQPDSNQLPLDLSNSDGNKSVCNDSFFSPPTPKSSLLKNVPAPLMYSPGPRPINSMYSSVYLQRLQQNPMFQDLQRLLVAECENYHVPTNLLKMSSPWVGIPHSTTKFDLGNQVFTRHTSIQDRMKKMREDNALRQDVGKLSAYYSSEVGSIEVARYQALCAASVSEHATMTVNNCFDEKRLKLINHIHSELDLLIKPRRCNASICSNGSSPDNDSFSSQQGGQLFNTSTTTNSSTPDLEEILCQGSEQQQVRPRPRAIVNSDLAQHVGTTARQLKFGDISKETHFDNPSPDMCRPLSTVSCVSTGSAFSSDSDIDVCDFSDSDVVFHQSSITPDEVCFPVYKNIKDICPQTHVSLQNQCAVARQNQNNTSSFLMDQVQNDLKCRDNVSSCNDESPQCDNSDCVNKPLDIFAMATAELDLPTSGEITDTGEKLVIDESRNNCEVSSTTDPPQQNDHPKVQTMIGRNRCLTPEATVILTKWYEEHISYPYPSDFEVQQLCVSCGLTKTQVKKWMANKRVRTYNTLSITGNQHPIKRKFKREGGKPANAFVKPNYQQLSTEARQILNQWYENHSENPYPSEDEKVILSQTANITLAQVRSWFANKRSRAHNTRRQVPNYFINKFPEYSPIVHMVSMHREEARRGGRRQRANHMYAPY